MDSKFATEHDDAVVDEKYHVAHVESPIQPRRPNIRAYAEASGLLLGFVAQQQMNTGASAVLGVMNTELGLEFPRTQLQKRAAELNLKSGPITNYPWMFVTWLVCLAILSSLIGSLSDRLGRRWFFIVGNIFALVGAIICAAAQSVNVVIVGMTFAGIGAANQQLAMTGVSELFRNKHRSYAQGALQLSPFPFTACGSLIGLSMAKLSTWRYVYYVNIIISGLALIAVVLFYHPPLPQSENSRRQLIKTADWVGIWLTLFGVVGLGLGFGPAAFGLHGWGTAAVLVPLLCGFTILFSLGVWETYGSTDPLHPPLLFKNWRRFPVILLVVVASTMPVYVLTFVWSQQVSSIYTTNPTRVGLSNFPTGFGTEIGVLFAALFMKRLGRTNLQLAAACLVLTIFVGLQATLTENSMRPALGYLSIAGLAIGYIEVASVVMAQLVVPDEYIGDATGLLITLRTIGAAIGISVCLTIVRSRLGSTWANAVAKAVLPLGLPQTSLISLMLGLQANNATLLASIPGISPVIIGAATEATKHTFAAAYRIIYYPSLALGIVAAAAAVLSTDVTSLMNDHLAVDLRGTKLISRQ